MATSPSSSKTCCARRLALYSLMLAALAMGQTISVCGHDTPLKQTFAKFLGKDLTKEEDQNYMKKLMSIGFTYPLGGMIGSLATTFVIQIHGRKLPTIILCFALIIGNLFGILSFSYGVWLFFVGRFFHGVGAGGLMVSSIMWFFELIEERRAGFFKPLIQILINVGIFATSVFAIDRICGSQWYLNFCILMVVPVILIISCLFLPESPVWLLGVSNEEAAKRSILLIQGDRDLDETVTKMRENVKKDKNVKQISASEFFRQRSFLLAILACIIVQILQQGGGINAIMAFAPSIMEKFKFARSDESALIVLGSTMVASMILAPLVGNLRRKTMLLVGHFGMALFYLIFVVLDENSTNPGVMYTRLISLIMVPCIFQAGPGPLCWFICLETFPARAAGIAQGLSSLFNWTTNLLVFLTFPLLYVSMGTKVMYIYMAVNLLGAIFIYFRVVETLNRTSEMILSDYGHYTDQESVPIL